ncbi:MAG: hypothetical protein SGI92_26420 [Bryobacteraceae bacterium]|nr:hypothetical protein [Bryobacteraceae bacterium]
MREALLATPEMAADYARWFVNRLAYTRQSDRPHPESGRHYYYRPRPASGGKLGLELDDVRRHLAGEITLGIYAINPETQRVKWMGIDADYKRSLDDLLKLQYELQQDGIQAALEQSRRGGHLWMLFETPVLAKHARVYIRHLAGKLSVHIKASGPSDGIELFPKQDRIEPTQFGNAIRGPLGIHRVVNRRYWFYGARHDLEAQMKYLRELRRVTEIQLSDLIEGLVVEEGRSPEPLTGSRSDRSYFQILDCLNREGLRRVGRNWVTQCPSCAAAGRDRGKDNLAVSVDEPSKYLCWAGCTNIQIRAALGAPAPVNAR